VPSFFSSLCDIRQSQAPRSLEERYGRRSTIVTSQIPVDAWHDVIGDPTYADAILDRLVHNATRIDLAGESLRRTRPRQILKG
jgi:DNA replication protein DnaC